MAKLDYEEFIDLDGIVHPDLKLKYRGEEYVIAGDTSVDRAVQLLQQYEKLLKRTSGKTADAVPALKETQLLILTMLQERHPELTECPFGMESIPLVLPKILERLGVVVQTPIEDPKGDALPPRMAVPKARKPRGSSTRSRR